MAPRLNNRPRRTLNLLEGVLRIILFDARGLAAIADTNAAFLASLAPLAAFWLVGAGLEIVEAGPTAALRDFLPGLVVLLGQPVIVHLLAARFRPGAPWRQYMAALNWSQLLLPFVVSIAAASLALVFPLFAAPDRFTMLLLGVYAAYTFALQWFLTWKALGFSPAPAALFVVAATLTLVLLVLPALALRLYLTGGFAVPGVQT